MHPQNSWCKQDCLDRVELGAEEAIPSSVTDVRCSADIQVPRVALSKSRAQMRSNAAERIRMPKLVRTEPTQAGVDAYDRAVLIKEG